MDSGTSHCPAEFYIICCVVYPQKGASYMENKEDMSFVHDAEYKGIVYLGHAQGLRDPMPAEIKNGVEGKIPYYTLYVFSPVSSYRSDSYAGFGYKAEGVKCTGPVWENMELKPGDHINLFFAYGAKKVNLITHID